MMDVRGCLCCSDCVLTTDAREIGGNKKIISALTGLSAEKHEQERRVLRRGTTKQENG